MRLVPRSLLFAGLSLILAVVVLGQKQEPVKQSSPKPQPSAQQSEEFDKIHEPIFNKSNADEAGKLTDSLNSALPASRQPAGPIPRRNYIDEIIFSRIERDKVPHAGLSTDEEFVRRVYLDATGALPSANAVREFVASKDNDKRDKLIDSLIGTSEFADQWAWYWGDLMRVEENGVRFWVKEWLKTDRPYNEFVADMLGPGAAKTHSSIPSLGLFGKAYVGTNVVPASPEDLGQLNRLDSLDYFSIDVARIFLGMNTSCISCHNGARHLETLNSYLAKKKRIDFYQNAAFFGNVRMIAKWDDRAKNNGSSDMVIDEYAGGYNTGHDEGYPTMAMNQYPRDGKTYEPVFLLTGEQPKPGANPRAELARMVTAHPQFRRALVNLVWGKLMTVAFVEPYDGFDLDRLDPQHPPEAPWTLQPTNAELLDAMQKDFGDHNYSVHHIIKTIMKSSAYQLSSHFDAAWNPDYLTYYNRKFVRVMTGPEVIDAVTKSTGRLAEFDYSGMKATRVNQLQGPNGVGGRRGGGADGTEMKNLLQSFFQSNRQTPAPIGNKASTLQALLMMSSKMVNDRVLAKNGSRVQTLLESGKSGEQIVEELFLSSLSRWPSPAEKQVALQYMEKDRQRGAENLEWVLLNGIEFVLNH